MKKKKEEERFNITPLGAVWLIIKNNDIGQQVMDALELQARRRVKNGGVPAIIWGEYGAEWAEVNCDTDEGPKTT